MERLSFRGIHQNKCEKQKRIWKMNGERIFRVRGELRQMAKASLLKMAFCQKQKNCVLGGTCPFLLEYQCILFCVSEILGQGCQMEKLRLFSDQDQDVQIEDEGSSNTFKLPIGPWLPGFGQGVVDYN
jgi:hypothetical protein